MDLDSTVCFCHHVTRRKIVNFVKQTQPRKASQISGCFEAGSGCGWCIPLLVKIHREVLGGEADAAGEPSGEQYEELRKRYLQGLRDGTVERNCYGTESPSSPAPDSSAAERDDFDFQRYFSRSRPDPDPETLR